MSKNYTAQELNDLIAKIEVNFAADLAKAEEEIKASALAKSEEDRKDEKAEEKEDKQEEHKEEDKKEESKPEEKDEDEREYDEEDLEELHKLYKAMHPKELSHHHEAIKKCMGMEMQKSEKTQEVEDLFKSENELLKSENEQLRKAVALITESFKKKNTVVPKQQAITELGVMAKSEEQPKELSRKEVLAILKEKTRTPDLKKSDRDLINKYCVGNASLDSIKHLLK